MIYDSERRHSLRDEPFEVHHLIEGNYVRCVGKPVWMPEIGLGIGRERGTFWGWQRE